MTWCLYFLTKHPEVQEKVYKELQEVLEDEDVNPQVASDLKSVKFLFLILLLLYIKYEYTYRYYIMLYDIIIIL